MTPNKQKIKGTNWEREFVELLKRNTKADEVKRIAGSGALGTSLGEPTLLGDVKVRFKGFPKNFRIECKTGYGGHSQLTVKREWLNKIKEEADFTYSIPALACKFSGSKAQGGVQFFIAFDIDTFYAIINYVGELAQVIDELTERINE